jgi:hypothetical protein
MTWEFSSPAVANSAATESRQRYADDIDDGPICEADSYPSYAPGVHLVRCLGSKKYWSKRFKRTVVRLDFNLLDNGGEVIGPIAGFLNLGKDGKVGPYSKFWRWWVIANGGMPAKKRQKMSLRSFKDAIFEAHVEDTKKCADNREKYDFEKYSTVVELQKKVWP